MSTEVRLESHGEERVLYILLIIIGVIPVAIAWASGARFGTQATIGGLMLAFGVVGLVRRAAQSPRR